MTELSCGIAEIDEFGGAVVDLTPGQLKEKGLDFGDVLDLTFSNGTHLTNVPYFNGYYVNIGEPVMVAYPGYEFPVIGMNCRNFHQESGVNAGDSVKITLTEKGGRKSVMDLRSVHYSNDPRDYASRDRFINGRELRIGKMAPRKLYRCASPFDHQMNRPESVSEFLHENHVRTTLSISESAISLEKRYAGMPSYAREIYESGNAIPLGLGSDYFSVSFSAGLVNGLLSAMEKPFPWAIHCLEGKDRTGFVCALLGILMDASYEELVADYMVTYDNYYGITQHTDSVRYNGFKEIFIDEYLRIFGGLNADGQYDGLACKKGVEDYLLSGGMSAAQIDALRAMLIEA